MDDSPPRAPTHSDPAFDLYGPTVPDSPVILSVPHAGRLYPPALLEQARVRPETLRRLEDRWVDLLVHPLIALGFTVLIARAPRALIDLNRHDREIDPAMLSDLPPMITLQSSAKLRGGLGLLPRRLAGAPELWRRPIAWTEAQRRIETVHRPYHTMIGQLMATARDVHGHAILIDLHSMPPLPPPSPGYPAPGLVLGDRFGRSASSRLTTLAADVAAGHDMLVALNSPYAGDYLIERHGRPERDLHALQIEIDRALYLDATLDRPGPGIARMRVLVQAMAQALAAELPRADYVLAAE